MFVLVLDFFQSVLNVFEIGAVCKRRHEYFDKTKIKAKFQVFIKILTPKLLLFANFT